MVKSELISAITARLKEDGLEKKVVYPKQTFHITDDEGNRKDFSVRKTDKTVAYTTEDVKRVFETCLDVIEDCIKNGEEVSISGFGTFGLHFRHGRTIGGFDGKLHEMKSHFVPKFWYGKNLRTCAELYCMSIEDENGNIPDGENIRKKRGKKKEEGAS